MTSAFGPQLAAALAELPIPGDWIVQGGAVSMLMLVALLVFTGRLVPRSTVAVVERDRDYWRQIALVAVGQADQLLPAAQIATTVSKALTDQVSAALHDVPTRPTIPPSGAAAAEPVT